MNSDSAGDHLKLTTFRVQNTKYFTDHQSFGIVESFAVDFHTPIQARIYQSKTGISLNTGDILIIKIFSIKILESCQMIKE